MRISHMVSNVLYASTNKYFFIFAEAAKYFVNKLIKAVRSVFKTSTNSGLACRQTSMSSVESTAKIWSPNIFSISCKCQGGRVCLCK